MLILILFLIFVSIALIGSTLVPQLIEKSSQINEGQAHAVVGKVDRYLREEELKKMYQMVLFGPIVLGAVGFFIFPAGGNLSGWLSGVFSGYIMPRMYIGQTHRGPQEKFNDQLMDAIMIMSSSFRGGLSLVQAFESVSDEMPEPCQR